MTTRTIALVATRFWEVLVLHTAAKLTLVSSTIAYRCTMISFLCHTGFTFSCIDCIRVTTSAGTRTQLCSYLSGMLVIEVDFVAKKSSRSFVV